jgi:hypothetical protein
VVWEAHINIFYKKPTVNGGKFHYTVQKIFSERRTAMVDPVVSTGLSGLQKSIQGVNQAARQIARGGEANPADDQASGADLSSGDDGLVKPIVDLKLYSISAKANAKVVQTGSDLLGTLLNTKA